MIVIDIFEENHRSSKKTPQLAPRSVVGAATPAASSRGSRTDFRSEIPKEMKMPTPNPDPGTTDPFHPLPQPGPAPRPGPVAVTDTSPKIAITNTDKRQIDNLRLSVTFLINGQTYYDYEDHGTFNQVSVDRVYAYGGAWNGSQWVGDFLHAEVVNLLRLSYKH
jgi:hypothetical protein